MLPRQTNSRKVPRSLRFALHLLEGLGNRTARIQSRHGLKESTLHRRQGYQEHTTSSEDTVWCSRIGHKEVQCRFKQECQKTSHQIRCNGISGCVPKERARAERKGKVGTTVTDAVTRTTSPAGS